jgi:hypothetical protein
MTNSVVPMPKDAAASARIGREIMEDPFAGDYGASQYRNRTAFRNC